MNKAIWLLATMGGKHSNVDNTGTVINDIQIQPATLENSDLILCVYVITVVLVINFAYKIYKIFHKNMKKKYVNASVGTI